MTDPAKDYMRERYDRLGAGVERDIRGTTEARAVWRAVEGSTPALAYFRRRKLETALRLSRLRPGASLLDLGCGTGDYTLILARAGFRMTGADISEGSLDAARAKAERVGLAVEFVRSDAETLAELPDGGFDGVVSFSALRYVDRLDAVLSQIARVLRVGGVAAVDFPNRRSPWFSPTVKRLFGAEVHPHDHLYTSSEAARHLASAGFEDVRVEHILFTSYLTPTPVLPLFRLADLVLERVPLVDRYAAIVMARGIRA